MVKAVIFDLGGVYFTDGTKIAIQKISRQYGVKPESVERVLKVGSELPMLYRAGKIIGDAFWNKAKKLLGIKANNEDLSNIWIESYVPVEEIVDIVKWLKRNGIKRYFLSDSVKERAESLQKRYHFQEHFINGIFSYRVHKTKRDGKYIFKRALEKTGEDPQDVLYIDDKEAYVETARELGMKVIHFKNPEQLKEELYKMI